MPTIQPQTEPVFSPIRIDGDAVTTEAFNRLQNAIQIAFQRLVKERVHVTSPIQAGTYQASIDDQYLVIDSTGGPVTISLPVPNVQQFLIVVHGTKERSNTVQVQRRDGGGFLNMNTGGVLVPASLTAWFLCDGKHWAYIDPSPIGA